VWDEMIICGLAYHGNLIAVVQLEGRNVFGLLGGSSRGIGLESGAFRVHIGCRGVWIWGLGAVVKKGRALCSVQGSDLFINE
jgi:hypothetical protein